MGWTAKGIAEVLGLVSIVASLVFVGLEVRKYSVATRASANATVADAFREVKLELASSPELAHAMVLSFDDPQKLSPDERVLVLAIWRSLFHTWSNGHRQWTNETLDEALYESIVSEISQYVRHKDESGEELDRRSLAMRWAWGSERFLFNIEFQQFVDDLIDTET